MGKGCGVMATLTEMPTDELHTLRRAIAARCDRLVGRQRWNPGARGRSRGEGRRQPLGWSEGRAALIAQLQAEYDAVAAILAARGEL